MSGPVAKRLNLFLARIETRLQRPRIWSLPIWATVEPTNRCNSRCIMCIPSRRDPFAPSPAEGLLEESTLRRSLPLIRHAQDVILTGCGEPFIHPKICEFLSILKEESHRVTMISNGLILTRPIAEELIHRGLDILYISLGGGVEAGHQRIRGVSLEPVLRNLEGLRQARQAAGRGPELRLSVVQMQSVLSELGEIIDLAAAYGARSIDMPQLVVPNPTVRDDSVFNDPEAAKVAYAAACARAKEKGIEMAIGDFPPSGAACMRPWGGVSIAFDGTLYSCSSERYRMGNILDGGGIRAWRWGSFAELRRRLRRAPDEICPACPWNRGTPEVFLDPFPGNRLYTEDLRVGTGPDRVRTERASTISQQVVKFGSSRRSSSMEVMD